MIQRRLKCDQCGGTFWQEVERRSAPPPEECPLCHNTGEQTQAALKWVSREKREADARVRLMAAEGRGPGYNADARLQLKSEEQVFRAMEAGADIRAQAAASELNVPVSEVSNLKITDLKDNPKTGEHSAKLPLSPTGHAMQHQAQQMSFGAGSQASAFAGQGTIINGKAVGTMVGPGAGMHGARAQNSIVQGHAARAGAMESRPMGRY